MKNRQIAAILILSGFVLVACQQQEKSEVQDNCVQFSTGAVNCPEKYKTFNLQESTEKLNLEFWQMVGDVTMKTVEIDFATGEAKYMYVDPQGAEQKKAIALSPYQLEFSQSHLRRMTFCQVGEASVSDHSEACFASPIRLKLKLQSSQDLEFEYGEAYNFCDNYEGVSELARVLSLFLSSAL